MRAIENDSQFLSSKFIMDYSLLCGFDQTNNDIVVGIIGKLAKIKIYKIDLSFKITYKTKIYFVHKK